MPTKRSDKDNLAKLERLRPLQGELQNQRVRFRTELERALRDEQDAMRAAEEEVGTSDIDAIRRLVEERWERNTQEVDEYEEKLLAVERSIPKAVRT